MPARERELGGDVHTPYLSSIFLLFRFHNVRSLSLSVDILDPAPSSCCLSYRFVSAMKQTLIAVVLKPRSIKMLRQQEDQRKYMPLGCQTNHKCVVA